MFPLLIIFFKGILMGAADVVPGVSGGTVAVVVGIYKEFITTLSRLVDKKSLVWLSKINLREYFFYVNGPFIVPLASGIFFSIFVLSHLITYFYRYYPILLWSFFFGLILASIIFLFQMIEKVTWSRLLLFALGTLIAYFLVSLRPISGSDEVDYPMIFLSGMVALSAMMLPGISGSFLLIIMGQYHIVLTAVTQLNLLIIALFALGGGLSLIFFSKLIGWLLQRHFEISLMLLTGFLFGSLKKIWPWRVSMEKNLEGISYQWEENVTPWAYLDRTQLDPYWEMAMIFFLIAFGLVFSVELYKIKTDPKSKKFKL